jgi:hypothetical protein
VPIDGRFIKMGELIDLWRPNEYVVDVCDDCAKEVDKIVARVSSAMRGVKQSFVQKLIAKLVARKQPTS